MARQSDPHDRVALFASLDHAAPKHERRITVEDAERIAFDRYRMHATVERLTGERDENFRIRSQHGEFVLKVASPDEDLAVVDLALAAMRHVERVDPSFPSPRVRLDRAGLALTRVADGAGRERVARMLTWLPGMMLQSAPRTQALRAACGSTAARLALALRDFRHPAAARPMLWDLRQLARLRPMLDDLPGYSVASYIAEFLDAYEAATEPVFPRLRRQVLHNDMNLRNVLVDPADPRRIAGLIDFGDAVETALIADLAVAASTQLLQGSMAVRADIMDTVNAYRATLPLHEDEMKVLNWLIAGRLVSGLVIPPWHQAKHPSSGHFVRKSEADIAERIRIIETVRHMRLS